MTGHARGRGIKGIVGTRGLIANIDFGRGEDVGLSTATRAAVVVVPEKRIGAWDRSLAEGIDIREARDKDAPGSWGPRRLAGLLTE
jgi:hypothetical protein